jgi:hypothetical protein
MNYVDDNESTHYLQEPILSSELILINNAKKLAEDPSLLNEKHLDRISHLRGEWMKLALQANEGVMGLQKDKRKIRDEIRDLSWVTYTDRDKDLFGRMLVAMVQGVVSRPQFNGYTYKDEMKSLAIQHILLYTWRFDPYIKSKLTGQYVSAFGYISTICFNACVQTILKFQKEQKKAKEDFLETQKLIHKDENKSTWGPDFSEPTRVIKLVKLEPGELIHKIKEITIREETRFLIPEDYKITAKEHDYILKYSYNISIERIK